MGCAGPRFWADAWLVKDITLPAANPGQTESWLVEVLTNLVFWGLVKQRGRFLIIRRYHIPSLSAKRFSLALFSYFLFFLFWFSASLPCLRSLRFLILIIISFFSFFFYELLDILSASPCFQFLDPSGVSSPAPVDDCYDALWEIWGWRQSDRL